MSVHSPWLIMTCRLINKLSIKSAKRDLIFVVGCVQKKIFAHWYMLDLFFYMYLCIYISRIWHNNRVLTHPFEYFPLLRHQTYFVENESWMANVGSFINRSLFFSLFFSFLLTHMQLYSLDFCPIFTPLTQALHGGWLCVANIKYSKKNNGKFYIQSMLQILMQLQCTLIHIWIIRNLISLLLLITIFWLQVYFLLEID